MGIREIPTSPIPISVSGAGWIPDAALHRRRGKYVHESSYVSLTVAAVLFGIAALFCLLPWDERIWNGVGPPFKYLCAAIFVFGGLSAGSIFYLGNHIGQRLVIDPIAKTVTLRKSRGEAVLHWLIKRVSIADRIRHGKPVSPLELKSPPETEIVLGYSEILGIQLCGSPPDGYQANLVFRTAAGSIDRDCLSAHSIKRFCTNLAQRYADELGFQIIDDIETDLYKSRRRR